MTQDRLFQSEASTDSFLAHLQKGTIGNCLKAVARFKSDSVLGEASLLYPIGLSLTRFPPPIGPHSMALPSHQQLTDKKSE